MLQSERGPGLSLKVRRGWCKGSEASKRLVSESGKGNEQTTAAREDPHLLRKLCSLSLSFSLRIHSEHVFKTSEKPGGYDDERFIHKLFLDVTRLMSIGGKNLKN